MTLLSYMNGADEHLNNSRPAQLFKEVFKAFNYTYSTYVGGPSSFDPSSNFTYLTGYFPCNAPPTLTCKLPTMQCMPALLRV